MKIERLNQHAIQLWIENDDDLKAGLLETVDEATADRDVLKIYIVMPAGRPGDIIIELMTLGYQPTSSWDIHGKVYVGFVSQFRKAGG